LLGITVHSWPEAAAAAKQEASYSLNRSQKKAVWLQKPLP